jgi:hypothetical protein
MSMTLFTAGIVKVHLPPVVPQTMGWFGWYKSRLVSVESIVFCERE